MDDGESGLSQIVFDYILVEDRPDASSELRLAEIDRLIASNCEIGLLRKFVAG